MEINSSKQVILIILVYLTICMASLPVLNNATELQDSLSKIISRLYLTDDAINYIVETHTELLLLKNIHTPRILTALNGNKLGLPDVYNNYIIFSTNLTSFNNTLKYLTSRWNQSSGPRGKYLIITTFHKGLASMIKYLWERDIMNVILISLHANNQSFSVHKANPFDAAAQCGKNVKLITKQYPDLHENITFYNYIKDLSGCFVNILMEQDISDDSDVPEKYVFEFAIKMVQIICKHLKTSASFSYLRENTPNEKEILYNRSGYITMHYKLARLTNYYDNYDLSNFIYRDEVVWVVPNIPRITNAIFTTTIFKKEVWGMIMFSIFGMSLVWWIIAKRAAHQNSFKHIYRCILVTVSVTLGGGANLFPNIVSLRFLLSFYLVYCLTINNIFQGNLGSILTKPDYERPVQSVAELAKSNLLIESAPIAYNIISGHSENPVFAKILENVIIVQPFRLMQSLKKVAFYKNCSTQAPKYMLHKVFPEIMPMINVIDFLTGLLDLEPCMAMRKGHYFMDTFNELSRRLSASGLHYKLTSNLSSQHSLKNITTYTVLPLSIGQFQYLFIWWGVGLSLASVAFLGEKLKTKQLNRISNEQPKKQVKLIRVNRQINHHH